MNSNAILTLRMERQGFLKPLDEQAYEQLFRLMQPVQTVYWCAPGDPPCIVHRAAFNDFEYNDRLRAERKLIKGRFQGGSIAYIYADELELYASAYKRNIERLTPKEEQLIELLNQEGPMNIQLIKQVTGMLVKEITPVLHKLQEAFLVYEDQINSEGDRGWYVFESVFREVNLDKFTKLEALKELIMRFLYLHVFAELDMIKSFYRLTTKDIKEAILSLLKEERITTIDIGDKKGLIRTEDTTIIESYEDRPLPQNVFVLHRNDYLVKANEYWLKEVFKDNKLDVLQYILVDGKFDGAVMGKFHNGPFEIEDIVLMLPEDEKIKRKDEIIEAVYRINNQESSPIKKYDGKQI